MNASAASIEIYSHPIFDPVQFRILTPPITELQDILTQLVWTGATGASLLGFSRAGKTTGIELSTDKIKARNGRQIPVIRYSAHRRDKHTIRALYENIMTQLDIHYSSTHKSEKIFSNLLTYLAETAEAHHVTQLIMVIDETQRLAIPQIDVFAELDDRLRKEYSVSLMCLFVGNKEQMGELLKEVNKAENDHIKGRFFRQSFRFSGLRSLEDVRFCLEQYDKLRYPEGGPTITEYFLPEDYAKGFRLASLTESVWGEFRLCQKDLHINDWAAEYFVRSVNTLITDYLPKFGVDKYNADMFRNCINVSGLYPDASNIEAFV